MLKNKKLLLGSFMSLGVLTLGAAYALSNTTDLTINGTLAANFSQSDFIVKFTEAQVVENSAIGVEDANKTSADVSASATVDSVDPTKATINVSNLVKVDDQAVITYKIKNDSADFKAQLSEVTAELPSGMEDYFTVTTTGVAANDILDLKDAASDADSKTITVKVQLKAKPAEDTNTNIQLKLTATAVENS